MKKLLLLLLFSISITTYASHYMGGEITWQCLGNGNFRFIMKLYRECNGVTFNSSEMMAITNYPGLTSVQMTLKPGSNPNDGANGPVDGRTDLSPKCWADSLGIDCYPNPSSPNTGAVEEWYYTSDQSYPNGVKLVGVPSATGWIFSHTSCCRNPCSNIPNANGLNWFLRAIMYPFNGANTFPCYDNSPQFADVPATVICSGSPLTYITNASDKELDKLSYEWAPALNGSFTTPVTYAGGYSFSSPLPGPAQNPLNVAATINPYNGEISFTSFTNGAFVLVIKVSEYRCGVLIGEIFRELQVSLQGCTGNNIAPFYSGPFYNPINGNLEFTDTVNVGDIVDFDIMALDNGTLPNGSFQTLSLEAAGIDFGSGFTNPNSGCNYPPCATLNPPPVVTGLLAVGTHFHWQTDCSHLQNCNLTSNYSYSTHCFNFKVCDNYCPVSGCMDKSITIILKAPIIKPVVALVTSNFVMISWNYYNGFYGKYYIYRAENTGPFILIDSTNNTVYNDFSSLFGHSYRYKILAKDTNGCEWWSTICSTDDWTGIESNEKDKIISIFPNPATNTITFETAVINPQLKVYNLSGQILMDKKLKAGSNTLDVSGFPQGMYFYRLTDTEKFLQSGKFIKE